jgi:hypothetical protein
MTQSTQYETDASTAVQKASAAITELRKTIGLPTGRMAQEIGTKIGELAREKDTLIEWDVRVVGRGDAAGAACNCHCYAAVE